MVRCIVVNQIDFPWKVASQNSFEVPDVRYCIEHFLKMIEESGTVQLDCSENLERVPLSRGWDFRLRTYPCPCPIEGRVLAEAGFVFEEDRRPFAPGFFLMLGYLYRTQRDCTALSAFANVFLGRWTEKPIS